LDTCRECTMSNLQLEHRLIMSRHRTSSQLGPRQPCHLVRRILSFVGSYLYATRSSHRRRFHCIVTKRRRFMGRSFPFAHSSGGRAASRQCELFEYNGSSHLDDSQEYVINSSVVPAAYSQADGAWFKNFSCDFTNTIGIMP
jgi:hypothetical protein